MKPHVGKSYVVSFIALSLAFAGLGLAGSSTATAQEQASGATPPPKVLVILREFLKQGKEGSPHQKSASAYAQAFTAAHWPEHYLAMDSLSGKPRSLFFFRYDSFEAWEKDNDALQKNATLTAAIDSAAPAESEVAASNDWNVLVYREGMSTGPAIDIAHMRYVQITMIEIRPGHGADWDALVKMHNNVFGKQPNSHTSVYEVMYGNESGGKYIILAPMKSLAEVDQHRSAGKQLQSSMSADQQKKMADLAASTIKSINTNLFAFDPKISYPPDSWVKADPAFWGQK